MCRFFAMLRRPSASGFSRKFSSSRAGLEDLSTPKKDIEGPFPEVYKPKDVEAGWYAWWVSEKLFELPKSNDRNKFTMVLPPPNVTGHLHVGHALAVIVEDVLQRWQRSCGSSCHWVPGFDHASIATQVVVEKKIEAQKRSNRQQMGRQAFVHEVLEWSDMKRHAMRRQLQSLGASLDWSREVFTMDETFSRAVIEAFVRLHEVGLIKRRKTLVNWCCHLESTISDMEVEHVVIGGSSPMKTYKDPGFETPIEGKLYRFAYRLAEEDRRATSGLNGDDEIVVATTRPETMLGDVAVAVKPDDPRFVRFVGRRVVHPYDGRLLPVIGDDQIDPNFGTGAMKVTPGHSHEDFALSKRCRGLDVLNVFDERGRLVTPTVPQFDGLNRFAARTAVIQDLDRLGLFRSVEDYRVTLPVCSRGGGVVEPLLKSQWFLETSQLIGDIANDLEAENLVVSPDHALKDLKHWLSVCKDSTWCLSRQLWWGHQIPAYRLAGAAKDDEESWIVVRSAKEAASKLGVAVEDLTRDEDVLDTWFSSGLFPFAAYGWPEDADAFRTRYPLSLMETGRDILFFWVIRMLMLGKQLTGVLPFREVLAHGLVCDAHGRKMSKSLGNVVDPMDIIAGISLKDLQDRNVAFVSDGYIDRKDLASAQNGLVMNFPNGIPECGADALRFGLCSQDIQDQTVSIDVQFVHSCKLFGNKIWQACRFYLKSLERTAPNTNVRDVSEIRENMSPLDLWILSQLSKMVVDCDDHLKAYDLHLATRALKNFWYFRLCDNYVEGVKPVFGSSRPSAERQEACLGVLHACIRTGVLALSPFMPFLAEELYQRLKLGAGSVCQAAYPDPNEWKRWRHPQLDDAFEVAVEVVSELRGFRTLFDLSSDVKPNVFLKMKRDIDAFHCEDVGTFLETLGRCNVNFDGDGNRRMLLKGTSRYELSAEMDNGAMDVQKSLTILEQRMTKLSKQLKLKSNVTDETRVNSLEEKLRKVESHVTYLRTFVMVKQT